MKNAGSLFLPNRAILGGVIAATIGVFTAGSLRAVDTPLYWYSAGEEGDRGGDGTWSQNNANPSRWYDEGNDTFYSWTDARTNFGYNGENLIVAIFSGTAGTVTVGNLGSNGQTFIGTVSVLTGGYTFTANNNSVTLAGSDRVNLLVNTADKTPVVFEEGLTVGLRNNLRTFEIAEGDELTIKGVIDNGRFNKTGAGTLRLTGGASTFDHNTAITVSEGTLFISNTSGSGVGNGGILVESGATLGGTGIIAPSSNGRRVRIRGTLSPGENSVGTLTFDFSDAESRLVFQEGAKLDLTLGTASDLVAFGTAGDWLLGSGLLTLNITQGEGFSYDEVYTIFQNATTEDFTLLDVTGIDDSTYQAIFTKVGDDYVVSFAAVPEPSVTALLGVVGVVLGGWHYRRRRRQTA